MNDQKLGATGNYPQGKLNEHDEGELRAGIAIQGDKIIINFGKPIAWLAMTKQEAKTFAELLLKKSE